MLCKQLVISFTMLHVTHIFTVYNFFDYVWNVKNKGLLNPPAVLVRRRRQSTSTFPALLEDFPAAGNVDVVGHSYYKVCYVYVYV
jgi:hypothetical protein